MVRMHDQIGQVEQGLPGALVACPQTLIAAQQIMLIHVSGTLQNPEPRREALPALNQALQHLGGELENRK